MRSFAASSLLLTAALSLAACADSPTAPVTTAARLVTVHQAAEALPLAGSCDIVSTEFVSFEPPILSQIGNAVCHVAHVGRITVRNEQQINVLTGAQVGVAVWTTASGDVIHVTSIGTATPTGPSTIDFSGTATITGGTGRFVGARGELTTAGTADNATSTGSFTYHGWITYEASARSNR